MKSLFFILFLIPFCSHAANPRDTIPVYFATGKSILTEGVQDGLIKYIYADVLRNGQQLQIVGYTDYVGGNQYNDALSKARAAAVKRFLLKYGFTNKDITICIGKGKIEREATNGNEGFARDRRVDIVVNPKPIAPIATEAKPVLVVAAPTLPSTPAKKQKPATLTDLTNAKENETIRMEKLYFYPGRHAIRPESMGELNRLEKILEDIPTMKIGIEGHICCTDPNQGDALDYDTHELSLSLNRAKAVYAFLLHKGIDEDRLTFQGFGATRKLVEEHTEEDADKNRRVEIRILER